VTSVDAAFDFEVPAELDAHQPPEARGRQRDDVRPMVAYRHDLRLVHGSFRELPSFLSPGDVLVINTSGTLPASLPAIPLPAAGAPAPRRTPELELHLSTPLPSGQGTVDLDADPGRDPQAWIVEFRAVERGRSLPHRSLDLGATFVLPGGSRAEVLAPYPPDCGPDASAPGESRLWVVALTLPEALGAYLRRHGRPIRYADVGAEWPVSAYQTVYAVEPGSAEMPSAGRAFTPDMLTELIARGVEVVPVTLHTGVSSLEEHEPPYAEFYRVDPAAARRVNEARRAGGRIVAVGTTAVRALESAAVGGGTVRPAEGWTDRVVSPETGVSVVDGLLTGWHEPRASHLLMLEAVAGRPLLERSYRTALERRYRWHEFGDLHLILP
jgi:S-adenosylmethionine:tRNA ribosyltransferase-isomerase